MGANEPREIGDERPERGGVARAAMARLYADARSGGSRAPPSPRGGSARAASPRSRARPALGFARRHGSPYGARHAPAPRAPARRRHRILRGSLDPVASPGLQLLQQQTQRRTGSPILGAVGSFFGANDVRERGNSHRATHQ